MYAENKQQQLTFLALLTCFWSYLKDYRLIFKWTQFNAGYPRFTMVPFKPSSEQNAHELWSDIQTSRQTDKQRLLLYIYIYEKYFLNKTKRAWIDREGNYVVSRLFIFRV